MTLIVECIPCQHGDHERHHAGLQPVAGRIGGWRCPCEGDCAARAAERKRLDRIADAMQEETYRQLVDASEGGEG